MQLTIDIPERVIQHAQTLGVPVEELVDEAIGKFLADDSSASARQERSDAPLPGFVRFGRATMRREEAGAGIREIASRHTLGGLNIKDLIYESESESA